VDEKSLINDKKSCWQEDLVLPVESSASFCITMDDEFIYADELSLHIVMVLAKVTSPDSNLTSARNRR